jgi:hypothetical protein
VELRDTALKMDRKWYARYGHSWPKLDERLKMAHRVAQEHGVDLAEYSPETMSLTDLKAVDDVMCASNKTLATMERRITDSHEMGMKQIPNAKKKSWVKTLKRVRKVRQWCRCAVPPHVHGRKRKEVWEALHTIRYMLWTMRSTYLSRDGEPLVVLAPEHVVEMSLVISLARKNHAKLRIEGALIQIPPGHFKTWTAVADRALQMNLHPERPFGILHNVKKHSEARYRAVREHFRDDTDVGRRRAALFPEIAMWKGDKTEQRFWLTKDGERKCSEYQEGALTAYGVHSRVQGVGMLELTIDDPSDEKEADQTGTREETNRAMDETWMNRLRGKATFWVYVCTSWHPDDYASQLKKMKKQGKINIAYMSLACGGPESDFKPICPEICDEHKLKMKYYGPGGPARYALVYQNDPDSPDARRLARLHYYDWELWRDKSKRDAAWDRMFCASDTEYWMTVDPSGSDKRTSDLAGAMEAAFGRMRAFDEGLGCEVDLPKIVFTEFTSTHASQINLAQRIADMNEALKAPPDPHEMHRFIIESTGGFHATSEHLEKNHDIPASKIIRKPPGTGTKQAKFRQFAAVLCETGDVLFPGVWTTDERGERVLTIHPAWADVVDQLMRAGSVSEDNLLDCVRQLCQELGHRIFRERQTIMEMKGGGAQRNDYQKRKSAMFKRAMRPKNPKTHLPRNLGMLKRSVA